MKKLIVAGLLLVAVAGCKGPQGSKGDAGSPGPGTITNYSGSITSDLQTVYIPAYDGGAGLSVFIGDSTGMAELPYFMPGIGFNAYYIAQVGKVVLYNTMTAGGLTYKIMVIKGSSSAGIKSLTY